MRRFLLVLSPFLLAAAQAPTERVVRGDGVTTITVDGVAGQVRANPAAPGIPLLTQDFADRAKLRLAKRLGIGFIYWVGPTRILASTRVARTTFGARPDKQRVAWTERRFSGSVDGTVGPAGLPDPVVRLTCAPPSPANA